MASWFGKTEEETKAIAVPAAVTPQPATAELLPPEQEVGGAEETDTDGEGEQARSLILLGEAERAIAQAKTLDELKGIRDKAEAARKYAQAAGMGLDLLNHAAEVKLRAERRAGKILSKLKLHGGDRREETSEDRLTLDDIGVSKDQSSRWQLAAAVPEREFDKYIEQTRSDNGEVTTAGLLRIAREVRAKQRERERKDRGAERKDLRDYEKVGDLDALVAGEKRFACVYADLPWIEDEGNAAFCEALKQLPISELCEPDSHIHLWASNESMEAAKEVMAAWGFEFKSVLVGLLPLGKPGDWWVDAHEFLLLGVRGELPFMERKLNSWMRVERDPDGRAPERVRRIIERVSPGPYLELFGSQPVSGWTIFSRKPEQPAGQQNDNHEGDSHAEATGA